MCLHSMFSLRALPQLATAVVKARVGCLLAGFGRIWQLFLKLIRCLSNTRVPVGSGVEMRGPLGGIRALKRHIHSGWERERESERVSGNAAGRHH